MINLIGKKFGRLTVIERGGTSYKKDIMWICKCDCGNTKEINGCYLRGGDTTSCGCWNREQCKSINFLHGETGTRFHRIWKAMKQRCTSPSTPHIKKHYKGKGIKVYDRWLAYMNFREDMHDDYKTHVETHGEKNTTIDRIDSNKNYTLENCRWATWKQQNDSSRKQ